MPIPALQQSNHVLTRSLLNFMRYLVDPQAIALSPKTRKHKVHQMNEAVLKLHGDPFNLFISCLEAELKDFKDLLLVMRDKSVCVIVLQRIWRVFDNHSIESQLLQLIAIFNAEQNIQMLTIPRSNGCGSDNGNGGRKSKSPPNVGGSSGSSGSGSSGVTNPSNRDDFASPRLSGQIQCYVQQLLDVIKIPPLICVMCYRCTEMVQRLPVRRFQSAIGWAVGNIIIQQYFVAFTKKVANNALYSTRKLTAIDLVVRFLKKLWSKSMFEPPRCLLNEILMDCWGHFDCFCDDIMAVANTHNANVSLLTHKIDIKSVKEITLTELYEFINRNGQHIPDNMMSLMQREGMQIDNEENILAVIEMWEQFQRELDSYVTNLHMR